MTDTETRARATDPDTSHDAAASLDPATLAAQQLRVLRALHRASQRHAEGGCTVSECVTRMTLDEPHLQVPQRNIVGRRITDLVELGLVADSGERRMAPTRRNQIVWCVLNDGRAALEFVARRDGPPAS